MEEKGTSRNDRTAQRDRGAIGHDEGESAMQDYPSPRWAGRFGISGPPGSWILAPGSRTPAPPAWSRALTAALRPPSPSSGDPGPSAGDPSPRSPDRRGQYAISILSGPSEVLITPQFCRGGFMELRPLGCFIDG